MKKFRGVSLPKDLIDTVERYIKENPNSGYKSKADFIVDSVRLRLESLGAFPPTLSLIHLNVAENYVLLWDNKIKHSVRVFITKDNVKCEYCDSIKCYHVQFAIKLPEVEKEFERRKKLGLPIPDLSYL
jgi:hypothetical protein